MDSVSSGAFALQILYLILTLAVSAACLFVSWTCVSTITLVSNGFSLLDPEAPAGTCQNNIQVTIIINILVSW